MAVKNRTHEKIMYSVPLLNGLEELNSCVIPLVHMNSSFEGTTDILIVSFSVKENAEFFRLEKEGHKVIFSFCGIERKAKKHEFRSEAICFEDVFGIDFINCGYTNGIRGSAILRCNNDVTIKFEVKTTHLICRFTQQKTIEFVSDKTGEVVFCMPTLYLEDAGGKVSDEIHYQLDNVSASKVIVSFVWDSWWHKEKARILPISIHWQLYSPNLTNISTYSKATSSLIETSFHEVGGEPQEDNEMFLHLKLPDLKANELVEFVSLVLTQSDVFSADRNIYDLELYHIDSLQSLKTGIFVDKTPLRHYWSMGDMIDPTYSFDITNLVKEHYKNKSSDLYLKVKLERRAKGFENYVVLHGATSNILFAPKMKFTYKDKRKQTTDVTFQKGKLVYIKKGSHYKTGAYVPEWICMQRWYIDDIVEDSVLLKYNEFGQMYNLDLIDVDCIILLE